MYIQGIIHAQAKNNPNAEAVLAPGRKPLTYAGLYQQVERIVKWLNAQGIQRNDRVAIVLPNGPEMAVAFLSVAAGATSAPLNPSYREQEFDFYLSDLNAKALIIQNDFASPARDVARAKGIPILEVSVQPNEPAGIFRPMDDSFNELPSAEFALSDDVALVLHTSGTTSRPKIVPLTQTNICISASNIKETLQLTERDKCLNVMPLFHIHGLMAAVLASITAGASIVCSPGFYAEKFFVWLSEFQPTWYTAVPTMHQTVLANIETNKEIVSKSKLRFIRSSSASLPPQVMKGLEDAFNAPMIESYGMTEASHQMTSNPLPPLQRKPGSVGIAAGPEVTIMDEAGNMLPQGEAGEIVIRGGNVTLGYENNPMANRSAFTNGWFRTGDQGVMDADGYLTITGRIKEMVNRGGEKIAPREVDEVLLDHPAVAQAVAFGIPHRTLGEDLGAAVVLRTDLKVTEKELRDFAFLRLADFKVPSQIAIVDEIPKGPTGKLQRIGLSEKLAPQLKNQYAAPQTDLQKSLTAIWSEALKLERVGIQDNFFALGGDSLTGVSVMQATEKRVKRNLHPSMIFRAPTIEQMTSLLNGNGNEKDSHIVPMQPNGNKTPLFLVPGHGGDVFTFADLTKRLPGDQPIYVFRFPEAAMHDDELANTMLNELVELFCKEMRSMQPQGPYLLGGFCFGGKIAFEMAQQLHADGQKTDLLALLYTYLPNAMHLQGVHNVFLKHFKAFFAQRTLRDKTEYLGSVAGLVFERITRLFFPKLTRRILRNSTLTSTYVPMYYPGRLTLFRPLEGEDGYYYEPKMGWVGLADELDVYEIPGNKKTMLQTPHVEILARSFIQSLDRTDLTIKRSSNHGA